jgi:TPR repeat protein
MALWILWACGVTGLLQAGPLKGSAATEPLWRRGSRAYKANDYRSALLPLMDAANQGDGRAQALLGIMYQDGDGVRASDREAAKWYGLAAAQGHRASQYALGAMYEEGEGGLPTDVGKAVAYYTLSAKQGFDKAQYALALNYEFGQGVTRNRATALSLLNAAAAQGNGGAGCLAGWLRSAHTPAFHDERELGTYIILEIEEAMRISDGGGGNPLDCGPVIGRLQCAQQLDQARIRKNNQDAGIKN